MFAAKLSDITRKTLRKHPVITQKEITNPKLGLTMEVQAKQELPGMFIVRGVIGRLNTKIIMITKDG